VRQKGDLPWQVTKDRAKDKAVDKVRGVVVVPARVWEALLEQVKVWEADEAAKEEWAEEHWGRKANAFVPSAEQGLHTKEAFPVSSRNAPTVEQPWQEHNRNVI
jgi:hypothetical protein